MSQALYRLLERPAIYNLSQLLLAPGARFGMARAIRRGIPRPAASATLLDVGCGPASLVAELTGLQPSNICGLDVNLDYLKTLRLGGYDAVVGSADKLPFADQSFGAAWSIGLLHHLPDPIARSTIEEMARVTRPGGNVVVIDAVYPRSAWHRPLAQAIRALDRGRHVRSESGLRSLFNAGHDWSFERFTFTANGLECVAGFASIR